MSKIEETEMVAKAIGRGLIPEYERNPYEPLGALDPDFAREYWGEILFLEISYQRHEEVRAEVGEVMERAASLPTFEERKKAYLGLPVKSINKVGSGVEGLIIDYSENSLKGASSSWRLYLPRGDSWHLWVQNITPSTPVKGAYKFLNQFKR